MTQKNNLERRVADLEREVRDLRQAIENARGGKDWRRTVGMFPGDEVMKQIDEAGRKIREADREKARRAADRGKALRATARPRRRKSA